MAKEHILPQSRLRKLIQGGRVRFISVDTSINSCGICTGLISREIGEPTTSFVINSLLTINSSTSDKELDDSKRIAFMSESIIREINKCSPIIIILEDPEKSVIYGAKKGGLNYALKRASSVCIIKCINYFIKGYLKAQQINQQHIITAKPSDWQCKKEIKKCNDSKDWSIGKTKDLITEGVFGITSLVVVPSPFITTTNVTEHSADAFLMMYELTKKAITEKI